MTNVKKAALGVGIGALFCLLIPRLWFYCQVVCAWSLILLAGLNATDPAVTVRSGRSTIPQVQQIETLFGPGDHFIAGGGDRFLPGGANGISQWSTDVYFAGRYHLVMWVEIEVDRRNSEVSRVIGAPKFQIHEVEWVDMSGGTPSISYRGSAQRDFSAADWGKVVEANGDFSVIGIQLRNDAPIQNFPALVKWSQSHRK